MTERDWGKGSVASVKGVFVDEPDEKGMALDISSHHDDMKTNERFPRTVTYLAPVPDTGSAVAAFGDTGTVSTDEGSLVVLDVGRWGSGTEGAAQNSNSWSVQRDFGIIYGRHVCLCAFTKAVQTLPDAQKSLILGLGRTERDQVETACPPIAALLASLDDAGGMGKVIVRRYLTADGTGYDTSTVHVFVGDMHIGVVSDVAKAKFRENDVPRRYGRVTVEPLEYVMTNLVPNSANQEHWQWVFVDVLCRLGSLAQLGLFDLQSDAELAVLFGPAGAVAAAGLEVAKVRKLREMVQKAQDDVKADRMEDAEVDKWFAYYHAPAAPQKPADIFEQAGKDLESFVSKLNVNVGNDGADPIKVKFVQMGDMFDLWVGFACHFTPSGSNNAPVTPGLDLTKTPYSANDKVADVGQKMLSVWANSVLETNTGTKVANAIAAARNLSGGATFLYGNHDNYFGAHVGSGPGNFRREANFANRQGIYAEHGHQWPAMEYSPDAGGPKSNPSANCDNKEYLSAVVRGTTYYPSQYLIGTPAPLGETVTQAAFIRPGSIRSVEGVMAGLASRSDPYGQRLQQIGAAADLYVGDQGGVPPWGIYVLAHTHAGNLTKCRIRRQTNADKHDVVAREWKPKHAKKIDVTCSTTLSDKILSLLPNQLRGVPHFGDGSGAVDVTVSWQGVIEGNKAWVTLVDPDAGNVYDYDHWVYTDDKKTGEECGSVTFSGVVPGRYEARVYLFSEARVPWLRFRFNVAGISTCAVTPDGYVPEGTCFISRDNPNHDPRQAPILVRWAGIPMVNPTTLLPPPWNLLGSTYQPWAGIMAPDPADSSDTPRRFVSGNKWIPISEPAGRKTIEVPADLKAARTCTLWLYLFGGDSPNPKDWGDPFRSCAVRVAP